MSVRYGGSFNPTNFLLNMPLEQVRQQCNNTKNKQASNVSKGNVTQDQDQLSQMNARSGIVNYRLPNIRRERKLFGK